MASELYIEEFATLMKDENGELMQAPGPLMANQKVTIGAGSAESDPFHERCRFVLLTTDTACQFVVGPSPQTADAEGRFLPANGSRWVPCQPGQVVAVIQQQ